MKRAKRSYLFGIFLAICCLSFAACGTYERQKAQESLPAPERAESIPDEKSDAGVLSGSGDFFADTGSAKESETLDEIAISEEAGEEGELLLSCFGGYPCEVSTQIGENDVVQKGVAGDREYCLTLNLEKWEGYTSPEQLGVLTNLFWEVYPKMYERFGVVSDAPVDVTIAVEAEGYEIAWAMGSWIHLRDEWLWNHPEDFDCITHELAHVIQNGWDENYLEYGAYIERFADYCRFVYAYDNGRYNDSGWTLQTVRDESTRETSVRFLVWLDHFFGGSKDLILDYFTICSRLKYDAADWELAWAEIFEGTGLEGSRIEDVWSRYSESEFAMVSSIREGTGESEILRLYNVRKNILER